MKKILFVVLALCAISFTHAQIRATQQTKATLVPYQKIKKVNIPKTFLSQPEAITLIKKTNMMKTNSAPAKPAGKPRSYSFSPSQMKDDDNDTYFVTPSDVYYSDARFDANTGNLYVNIANCGAPGYYILQLNCLFYYDGTAEFRAYNVSGNHEQLADANIPIKATQPTKIVLGINLVQGQNNFRILCTNNFWDYSSMSITPIQ